jgi:hypothetical protein
MKYFKTKLSASPLILLCFALKSSMVGEESSVPWDMTRRKLIINKDNSAAMTLSPELSEVFGLEALFHLGDTMFYPYFFYLGYDYLMRPLFAQRSNCRGCLVGLIPLRQLAT